MQNALQYLKQSLVTLVKTFELLRCRCLKLSLSASAPFVMSGERSTALIYPAYFTDQHEDEI